MKGMLNLFFFFRLNYKIEVERFESDLDQNIVISIFLDTSGI